MHWKLTYGILLIIVLGLATIYFYFTQTPSNLSPAVVSSMIWGGITLVLCLIFMLGAAQTAQQFLIFFATGAFGAGMGYLVGAWLTPSGESNPLDQMRNIVAGVLTGVVGTKLLSLWDDLVDRPPNGGRPLILTGAFFTPIVLWLVGFTVSLSAFYTVRTTESGDVRITYSPHDNVRPTMGGRLGILPETAVTFAAAANSPDDVSTTWNFHLEEPCGSPINNAKFDKAEFDKQMVGAFNAANGVLTTPAQDAIQGWINSCPGAQNWILVATSVQDRSKYAHVGIKFCRTKEDCPLDSTSSTAKSQSQPVNGTPAKAGSVAPANSTNTTAPHQ